MGPEEVSFGFMRVPYSNVAARDRYHSDAVRQAAAAPKTLAAP